jgi:hypothetical protein
MEQIIHIPGKGVVIDPGEPVDTDGRGKWSVASIQWESSRKFATKSKQIASLLRDSFEDIIERAGSTQISPERGLSQEEMLAGMTPEAREKYLAEKARIANGLLQWNALKWKIAPDVRFELNGPNTPIIEFAGDSLIFQRGMPCESQDLKLEWANIPDEQFFEWGETNEVDTSIVDRLGSLWQRIPVVTYPFNRVTASTRNMVTNRSPEERAEIERGAREEARETPAYIAATVSRRDLGYNLYPSDVYKITPRSEFVRPDIEPEAVERLNEEKREVKAPLIARYIDDQGLVRLITMTGSNEILSVTVLEVKLENQLITDSALEELAMTALANIKDLGRFEEFEKALRAGAISGSEFEEISKGYLEAHPRSDITDDLVEQLFKRFFEVIPQNVFDPVLLSKFFLVDIDQAHRVWTTIQ